MSFRTKAIGAVCAVCVAASGYVYSQRSISHLVETRTELQLVSHCALKHTPVDFVVIDGGRSDAEHKINLANGKSWTTRSRHQDGAAIDVAALVNGQITYDPQPYYMIDAAFQACSAELAIPIVWGGTWRVKDLMHFELDRRFYP